MNHVIKVINDVTTETFRILGDVYKSQKEGYDQPTKNVGTRLIFPHYSSIHREKETRISEQELRFLFIEQFNKYCFENNIRMFYSIETPTEHKYSFDDKDAPRMDDEEGQSAMVDLTIHNEKLERIALIEFKALNPDVFCFKKDFCKLTYESDGLTDLHTFFIMIVKSAKNSTLKSLKEKIEDKKAQPTNPVDRGIHF